ncbi:MAG: hypothetical protein NTX00_01760 [Candidatus Parcubacteria bacterium]|nr:hypothetical protein [Candidatus Parcubacteria bacterium]
MEKEIGKEEQQAISRKEEKTALILLFIAVLIQTFTFAFLWNPEKFREAIQKFLNALKSGKDKVKNTFKKEKPDS